MRRAEIEGNLVEVVSGSIFPARVTIIDGKVADVRRLRETRDRFILPGLIDGHIHIESTLLCPTRFTEAALAHGTTAVVADPHEIANVLGMEGVRYMVEEAERCPLRIYYAAPSCVPAVHDQDFGFRLGWREVRELLSSPRFISLGEVMDFREVLRDGPEIMSKIEVAKELGKQVDGHAPGLGGADLETYIAAGITSDHECTRAEEAEEKHRLGMRIMVREGSASKDMHALMPFARDHECLLVVDDLDASDLAKGHLDALLRKAVAEGMDQMHAVRAVTYWPARHFNLPLGAISEGNAADITVVRDLQGFEVLETWIGGVRVAKGPKVNFTPIPSRIGPAILAQEIGPEDLRTSHPGPIAEVGCQVAMADSIFSMDTATQLNVVDGVIMPDLERDVLLLGVVNRYVRRRPLLTFANGFGLSKGAIASSVSHDAHNIIGVGTTHEELAEALNLVISQGGGYVALDGSSSCTLPLPIAGLMSDLPCQEVAAQVERMNLFVSSMGCPLPSPFMTLSFQDPAFRRAVMGGMGATEGEMAVA